MDLREKMNIDYEYTLGNRSKTLSPLATAALNTLVLLAL